jgi:hypothetical protein
VAFLVAVHNGTEARTRWFTRQLPFNLALTTPIPLKSRFGEKVKALIRLNRSTQHPNNNNQDPPLSPNTTHPMVHHQQLPANPPTKQNIKAWWNQFGFVQKTKKDTTVEYTYHQRASITASSNLFD